jgi:acyl-CoA dehydrogenase
LQEHKEELEMIRQTARRFVRTRLVPLEAGIDAADEVDPAVLADLRHEASRLGLYGFNLPEELGGLGLSTAAKIAILEEITHTSVPLSEVIGHLPLSMKFFSY